MPAVAFDLQSCVLQGPRAPPEATRDAPRLRVAAGPRENRAPADQRSPGQKPGSRKGSPRRPEGKVYPPQGEEHGRGFAPLGLGYCLRKAGQAYAGCLALSCMGSMATAIRNSTMRCWGPRGPKTEPLPVSQESLTLIEV